MASPHRSNTVASGALCVLLGLTTQARAQQPADVPVTEVMPAPESAAPPTRPSSPPVDDRATRALADAIEVQPGVTCLQHARVVEHVQVWLGRSQVQRDVRVVVRGDENQRRRALFDITHGGPVHRRVFDALPDICGDAHAVLSLAIALAIDAEIAATVAPTAAELPAASRDVLELHAHASLSYALLPDLAAGGGVALSVAWTSWLRLRAAAMVQYSRNDTIASSRGSFDATWWGGSAQLCTGGDIDQDARLWLCAGLAGGAVRAAGSGYAPNRHETAAWLGARSGAHLQARLGVWWSLDLEVFSSAIAPRFQTTAGSQVAHQRASSATGFVLSLGPVLAL